MEKSIVDFSKTQRIVLFIDLQPLLTLRNPNDYITTIIAAAKRLLTFPALSTSFFAFKLFFSSLSPIGSSSAVHRLLSTPSPNSLSFNHPPQTLDSLSTTLNSLSLNPQILTELSNSSPLGLHISSALLQLVHDYAWESEIDIGNDNALIRIRSNLVIVFSPICKSLSLLYNNTGEGLNCKSFDKLIMKLRSLFNVVNDAYISRDIHCSWINVNYGLEEEENEYQVQSGDFKKGIRSLNWGFCSTDAIVLGSALVPFELIYPNIGVLLNFPNFDISSRKKRNSQLTLEISDVRGNPLECKCCDLEMLNLKSLPSVISDDILKGFEFKDSQDEKFTSCFGEGITKLHVKAVWKISDRNKLEGLSSNYILVREFSGESKKGKKKGSEEFFADKVMNILSSELGEISHVNTEPIWQIFLSFLNKEGFCALVSISNESGNIITGVLKPFTAYWALLLIIENGVSNLTMKATEIHDELIGSQNSVNENFDSSQGDGKKRKSKKHQNLDLTWSSFRNSALECSNFDLAEVYIAKILKKSKKLKFFICWMKQIIKHSHDSLSLLSSLCVSKSSNELLTVPIISTEKSIIPEENEGVSFSYSESETSESFFNNLHKRIEHGLQSKMDLQPLAEQLVKSSIFWLNKSCETDQNDSHKKTVFAELKRLLIKESKEMKELRERNCSSKSSESTTIPDSIVRAYELQIFFRMEILRSDISECIEEAAKQKFIDQICAFMEIIQFLVEGGIHGQVNLCDYVERNIKSRYSEILEDIVNKIYTQMDLLPFGDEDEAPILLFNSEDSNQSWREKKAETNHFQQSVSVSAEDFRVGPENNDENTQQNEEDECARKLNEARAMREKTRRFVSFTKLPIVQRVRAPTQRSKAIKAESSPLQKKSRNKKRRRGEESVVCETPLSGNKPSSSRRNRDGEEDYKSSNPVSKALFQD